MKRKPVEIGVVGKQNISTMCLVCGEENPLSLHAHFYNLEDGGVCADFTTGEEHQSYPGRVHGGIISAILDEAIGRAVQNENPEIWGVTMELTVKFRKPVPLGVPLKVVAYTTKLASRIFEGNGSLLLEDGTVAAEATARYACLPVDSIAGDSLLDEFWRIDPLQHPDKVVV